MGERERLPGLEGEQNEPRGADKESATEETRAERTPERRSSERRQRAEASPEASGSTPALISATPLPEAVDEYLPFGDGYESEAPPERPAVAPPTRETLLPVSEFVRLYPREILVLNHPAFQRLGSILQLGQTFLVFRGATHCRFEHAIGTVHMTQMIIDSLDRSASTADVIPEGAGRWQLAAPLSSAERRLFRLGALLHDLGHLAAGHTLEDELGLLDHHDADERLNLIFDRRVWHGLECEQTMRELVDMAYADAAAETKLGMSATEIVLGLVSRDRKSFVAPEVSEFRVNVGRDIIGNTICADLLDYIHRDWAHLGKQSDFDARLLDYMEIRQEGDRHELVINLRTSNDVRSDAVSAMLALLESRYQLGEVALYHKTKVAAASMLERIIAELDDLSAKVGSSRWRAGLAERLLEWSDWELLGELAAEARALMSDGDAEVAERAEHLFRTIVNLRTRRLHKKVFQMASYELAGVSETVHELYADGAPSPKDDAATKREKLRRAAENRLRAVRTLERDFGLPPLSVVMYCPPPKMNTKVANVKVLFNERVKTLEEHEASEQDQLTGGHLGAQKRRFQRLWRVQFSVERSARTKLRRTGQYGLFIEAIEKLVLGKLTLGATPESAARDLAVLASGREESPLYGQELLPVGFNRGADYVAGYPTGAPSLSQHIRGE
jgi:HD superfamily phosphohydrolase